jgi:hypothetical protein
VKRSIILAAIGFALTATIAPFGAGAAHAGKDRNAIPEATPAGKPLSCIPLTQIRETRVHGDRTIDFHMSGGKVYRNTLPYQCNSLGFEERFSYATSLNQLCSTDMITVIRTPISSAGPSCGLGQFQPITLADRKKRN